MKTIDLTQPFPYSTLIPAMKAIYETQSGEQLELIFQVHDMDCFKDLKEFLSQHNVGFREIYNEDTLILQFYKNELS